MDKRYDLEEVAYGTVTTSFKRRFFNDHVQEIQEASAAGEPVSREAASSSPARDKSAAYIFGPGPVAEAASRSWMAY
ncbi:MAG TPA: hypothetical protein VLW52_07845 [Opitutaceae bacterium]|nr:hypothetical protein [Opitutaceae bacterium]